MKKHLIFDLDGTLIDSMPVWRNVGADFLKRNGVTPPENLIDIVKKQTLPETAHYFKERWQLSLSAEDIMSQITEMVEQSYRYHVPLKPFAREYLEQQKALGTKMCILTASESSYVQAAVERLGLPVYFEFILTCTEIGLNKHNPQVFLTAMNKLGGVLHNTAVFEDAPYAIRTAKAGGFYVVAVADDTTKDETAKIQSLSDKYISSYQELL